LGSDPPISREAFWRFVSDYGNLASVAGYLLSIMGFGLTIASSRAARKAAVSARESVIQVKSQLLSNELATCIQTIKNRLRNLQDKAWGLATQSCVEAEVQLSRVASYLEFNSEELSRHSRAVDDLRLIHDQIERVRREKQGGQLGPQAHSKLNDIVLTLSRMDARLKSRAREFER